MDGICSPGFWQASLSCHLGLSAGLPSDITAVGSPQEEWPKREVERTSTKTEGTSHSVCHTLLIRSESICRACPHPRKEDYTRAWIPRGGHTHWMSMWQGHVGSLNKICHLGVHSAGKSSSGKYLLLDVRHLRQSLKGLEESILGYVSRNIAQSYPAELRISRGPCGCRAQRKFAFASPSSREMPGC